MNSSRVGFLYLLLFFSGLAGLGYEMVWARMLAANLGHEIPSTLAVVSAFFAGLALGSWVLDGPIRRSVRPGCWYTFLEAAIGAWSLVLVFLIPAAGPWMASFIGLEPTPLWQWSVCFVFPLVLLLPATFAMGATLPAAEHLINLTWRYKCTVGGLYAANTGGAVVGIGLITFLLVPALGYGQTSGLLTICNFVCAGGALWLGARVELLGEAKAPTPSVAFSPSRLAGTLFVTGLLGIGYEVLAVRVASQVLENTVYSFACVLAVYLLGTAAGAALYQRFAPRQRFRETLANLLAATSILCLSGVFVLWHAEPVYHLVRDAVGGDMLGSLVGELTLSTAVLLLPTAAMGSTFSHLAQEATHNGLGLGRALAVNTLGCALAPASFGIVLLPELGSVIALVLTALAYITLAPYSDRMSWLRALAPAGLAATALFVLSPQQLVALFPGEKILEHSEGVMAAVTVVEDEQNQRHLRVNSRFQMGGTATAYSDQREAHIPLLLHPDPRTALFLGTGTGITFATAAHYPNLRAEGVELIPEIVALMRYFQSQSGYSRALDRLQVSVADARRYVQASPRTYDVIVADLFHPARDGAGSLYTVEHFRAIRERLAPEGLFVQWLPLYQLDLNTLRTIIRTYLKVFPDAHAVLAHYSLKAPIVGLIGGNRSLSYPYGWLAQRAHDSALAQELASLRLGNDFELFGCFLADARTLHQFAGEGPLNTDDYPVVIFAAPRFAYANPEPAEARFLALIDAFPPRPELVLEAPSNEDTLSMHRRMKAYFRARNRFLHTGVGKTENPDIQQLVRELREPLLAVVRTSTDFAAAYNPLLAMAYQLHRIDPASSKRLLQDLEKANPLRSDARELRQRLFLD